MIRSKKKTIFFQIFFENKASIDDLRIRAKDWYYYLRKYSNQNYKWSPSRGLISFRGISPRRNPKQRHYTPILRYVCVCVCVCSLDPLSIPRGEIWARAKGVLSHAMLFIILLTSPETIVFGIVSGDCLAPVVSEINDRYSITHHRCDPPTISRFAPSPFIYFPFLKNLASMFRSRKN